MTAAPEITRLIRAASAGDVRARDSLFESIYGELQKIAKSHRRRWQGNHTLNTTALINEAYLKLANGQLDAYRDRTHFYATASRAMRQVLINYAERVSTAKRGGDLVQVTMTDNLPAFDDAIGDLIDINAILERIESTNERHCRLFECRVFGGMTVGETADALGVSAATVKRDWQVLSAWIYRELHNDDAHRKPESL